MKLRTLDCASSSEGCKDLPPDARRAEGPPTSPPDAAGIEPADAGTADLAVFVDAPTVAPLDSASSPDVTGDRSPLDAAKDPSAQDASTPDVTAKEAGLAYETGRTDAMDTMAPDTARTPDTRPPDLGPLPDAGPSSPVTFSAGMAKGAMTGYGWVTMGSLDIVSSPTCGSSNAAITKASPCVATSTNWESSTALCISGTIPALPASPTDTDYKDNWGLQVGANVSEPLGALGTAYRTLTLNFTGSTLSSLRATVHRTGDNSEKTYCATVTSGTAMVLTNFNTECWSANSGTALTTADLPLIDKVGLEVPSGSEEIAVSKLCLTGIVFGS